MARPTKTCAACGGSFERNPSYGRVQWERALYCSNRCRGTTLRHERALCACGCGLRVSKPKSRWRQGHNPQPEKRKTILFDGRRWYVLDRAGRKVYWARVVLEDKLGRALLDTEVAHHLNNDSTDDRPENLQAVASNSDHVLLHWRQGDFANR